MSALRPFALGLIGFAAGAALGMLLALSLPGCGA
jgi:hypothetical protein